MYAMNELSMLSLTQANFIIKLLNAGGVGFAEGKIEGGAIKELSKKGWIEPFGRVRRQIRWRLVKGFSLTEENYIKSLCDYDPKNMVQTFPVNGTKG